MRVFIDESGDPGFKVAKGSSPIFVAAMVIFETSDAARAMSEVIACSEVRRIHKGEFKFNKCSNDIRDRYFSETLKGSFKVRAIVVQKDVIYSENLKTKKERFYEYFVKSMLRYDGGALKNAKIVIDGSGDRLFRRNLEAAMRRRLSSGSVKDVRFRDSRNDSLVQLADMCVGAIARSYRTDRPDADRWRKMLNPQIEDIWDFR